jgi:signal transduction histidine kinase
MLWAFAAAEALFKSLVGYSYLFLAGAATAAERWTTLAWYVGVALPFTTLCFAGFVRLLAPIRAWRREHRAGAVADATIERAGEALHRLPIWAAWLWMLEWSATFAVLLTVREVTCVEAGVLFLSTMVTGPLPVAGTLAFWLATPCLRQVSMVARERGLTLRTPALPLRRRLVWFGMLIAITPTTYVASFAFSAQVSQISIRDMVTPVVMCTVAIVVFAAISASLMAASITQAVAAMAQVVRAVAHQGDVSRIARIPQLQHDEVGGLAASINQMIDRLERTEAERLTMSESLAALNHALEQRVLERTTRLYEANSVLQTEMAAREKAEVELRQAQKLEAVGRLATGVAHEINTPMQFVGDSLRFVSSGSVELIAMITAYRALARALVSGDATPAAAEAAERAAEAADLDYLVTEIPGALALAQDGLDRVTSIVRSMKTFAHPGQEPGDADLNQGIVSTLTIARHEYKYVADVDTELGELPLVRCHPGEINQVVLNLIVNAAHAISELHPDGRTRGRIGIRTFIDGGDAVIAVSDTGSGISEAIRGRIFEPFFTTKGVDRGTGQGLAIARTVVAEKHGGSLTFTTEVGKGTTFTIRLPIQGRCAGRAA